MKPDIAAIQKRCEKATPGPWVSKSFAGYHNIYQGPVKVEGCGLNYKSEICEMEDADCSYHTKKEIKANAEFIANARTDIPALLSYIAELKEVAEAARIIQSHLLQEGKNNGHWLVTEKRFTTKMDDALAKLDGDGK